MADLLKTATKIKMDKKERIIPLILIWIIVIVVSLFLLNFALSLPPSAIETALYDFCENKNWTGIHNITGDLLGSINCEDESITKLKYIIP